MERPRYGAPREFGQHESQPPLCATPVILPLRSSLPTGRKLKNLLWRLINIGIFPFTFRLNGVRRALLKAFGAAVANDARISPSCKIEFPQMLELGSNSSIGHGVFIQCLDFVKIGANVCISDKASILTGSHQLASAGFDLYTRPVTIQDACWVGYSATILPGVTMAVGSVVGAASVLTKSTKEYEVWAGNPGRVVRTRSIYKTPSDD